MPPILPGRFSGQTFKKEVKRQLKQSPTSQLVTPIPIPASPFGGASPPDSMWKIPVTSASFGVQAAQPWLIYIDKIFKLGFQILIPVSTDSGTTGEIRLTEFFGQAPNAPTTAISLPAASSGNVQFNWLHGMELYALLDTYFVIEARRTGGAGNVNVGYPLGGGLQVGPENCTEEGV